MIKKDVPISIEPVANGFMISPSFVSGGYAKADVMVFQTFAELGGFLAGHFTHRNQVVEADKVAK